MPRKRAVVQRVIDSYNGVPCTEVRPDDAPNRPGEVCGEIHDRCIGHQKASAEEREERRGDPCQKPARQGLLVCASHGGSTQTARAKGAAVMAQEAAAAAVNKRLGHGDATPVTDPAGELARLAGELMAYERAARALVAELGEVATDDDGVPISGVVVLGSSGLDVHPLVKLHERARDAALKWMAEMVKLGFVERHMQLEQAQADALHAALTAVLVDHGIDPGVVLPDLAARLHAIEAQATEAG